MLDLQNQYGLAQQGEQGWGQQQGFFSSLLGNKGRTGSLATMFNSYDEYVGYCLGSNPHPDSEGWYEYIGNQPPKDKLCLFKQDHEENEGGPWIGYAYEFRPEMNVAYLKWKFTGIAKETR